MTDFVSDRPMRICVFGSSSKATPRHYLDAAFKLGQVIGSKGLICVNGAGKFGVMGAVSSGVRSAGGKVVGVIHECFVVDNQEDNDITEMIVSRGPDLNERKQLLMDNGDAIVVLPGGVGTFDELWDVVLSKSLSMKNLSKKPICIINVNGFFDGSILQLKRAHDDGLLYNHSDTYFHVVVTAEEAVQYCQEYINSVKMDDDLRKETEKENGIMKADASAVQVASERFHMKKI